MPAHDDLGDDAAFGRAREAARVLLALVRAGDGSQPDQAAEFLARGILMAWAQAGGLNDGSAECLRRAAETGLRGRTSPRETERRH